MNIAVFVSGTGSNLEALLNYEYQSNIKFNLVFSDNYDPPAFKYARQQNINIRHFPYSFGKKMAEERILTHLRELQIDFIVLAGYMRLLSPKIINEYPKKIINIHPSLLPKYKGLDTHRRAIDNGEQISGCTIHYVDEGMDTGEIIEQRKVIINKDDTPEILKNKIQIEEHKLYPKVLDNLMKGN